MRDNTRILGMTLGLFLAIAAPTVEACSRAPCPSDVVAPSSRPGATRTIPSNLPAVAWGVAHLTRPVTAGDIRLVRDDDPATALPTTFTPLTADARIAIVRPTSPWTEGRRYTLTVRQPCTDSPGTPDRTATYLVGPPLALPNNLGTLTLGPITQGDAIVPPDSGDGSCGTAAVIARRTPALALAADAMPWSPFLLVQFLVDGEPRGNLRVEGEPIPWRSHFDGPDDLPYVVCSTSGQAVGLTPGMHRFQYRASVIGSDTVLFSNEVSAEIACASSPTDAGVGDAGVGDAGVGDAGVGDAGVGDAGGSDGGGCSVPRRGARASGAWAAAWVALCLGLVRGVRQRRRPRGVARA